MGRCLLHLRDRKKVRAAETDKAGGGVEQGEVGEKVRSQITLGPNGHDEKFGFYL